MPDINGRTPEQKKFWRLALIFQSPCGVGGKGQRGGKKGFGL